LPGPVVAPAIAPALAQPSQTPSVAFDVGQVSTTFSPLRFEPPPRIFATWWVRYLLFLAQLVGIAVVLMAEFAGVNRIDRASTVLVPYVLAATMLVCWSALAMVDAARLVPATQYQRASSATLAVALWLVAFAAPAGGVRMIEWARDRFGDSPDDLAVVAVTVVAVLACFVLVWLPFHYHTTQAHRIGAPGRVVSAWFWLPLVAGVGALLINSLGLYDALVENGVTDMERTVQVGVVFGLPALVLALTTWRATTVFDEVVDLRWRRWKVEWEQTLASMSAQPPPGPEAAARLAEE
jgi:hypothetical protein